MSVTAAPGFVAAGVACGIKPSGDPDLALVAAADGRPVPAAGVFTSNLAAAAPVEVSRAHLARTGGHAAAVVLNSGNANAATGDPGRETAARTCALVAHEVGCQPDEVLVCSTGLIGIPLSLAPIERAMPALVAALAGDRGSAAAEAIRTTDTVRKEVVVEADGFVVGGMAKGAAMLAPAMATMLAVLTTDATADPAALDHALRAGMDDSFHALTVDGCTSTNDTVLLLASGQGAAAGEAALTEAVARACADLAAQMADDAEGATKVVRVQVTGASSTADARQAARKVAESLLVKCSFYGEDPYWGRVVSELGSAGVPFALDRVSVAYGGVVVAAGGVEVAHDAAAVKAHLGQRHVHLTADLGLGQGEAVILTNDLTHAYVDENMRTS